MQYAQLVRPLLVGAQQEVSLVLSMNLSLAELGAYRALQPAGSTVTCTNALTISAVGSNVRINVASVTPTGATLSSCAAASTPKDVTSVFVLDPTAATDPSSITCTIVSATLTQNDYEAGNLTWSAVANNVVAKGDSTALNSVGGYAVSYTKILTQVRDYRVGIKRIPLNATDSGTDPVVWAGKRF